ncbi:MAG: 30S ribosomal protein S4 [Eubacteriales bacterium]|nr:30S ribosomal protein S4 [Eubacteriales bacterium]
MARYTEAACKLCRREGEKLFLKGDRCYTDKCAISKRAYAPGQHGQRRKKLSEYGIQLREKQKARRFYGILERQFRKYFEMAANRKGVTGVNLLQILESRFDNVVYRLGFAPSRAQSRQLVNHGHFNINGQKVDIVSYLLKPGDVVTIDETSKKLARFKNFAESLQSRPVPEWLSLDTDNIIGKVVRLPSREEIDLPIQEHLIIELYSK